MRLDLEQGKLNVKTSTCKRVMRDDEMLENRDIIAKCTVSNITCD